MKRTLAFLLVAMTSAALAQTPTVVEKPAVKKLASQTQAAKTPAKTPAKSSKPSAPTVKTATVQTTTVKTTTVKVVPVPASKPAVVAAKPVAIPAHPATVKAAVVPAPRPSAAPGKPAAVVVSGKPVVGTPRAHAAMVSAKPALASAPKLMAVPMKSDPFKAVAAQRPPAKMGVMPVAIAAPAAAPAAKTSLAPEAAVEVQDNKPAADNKPAEPVHSANRRDPFVSPVVNLGATGSGCSSGKRCLAIDEVALKGVVKSDGGMIAVVVNSLDKAYFLRENDPVFNGYVLKITVDSIVFKETFHDKLGKPLTRDVTKSISPPVA